MAPTRRTVLRASALASAGLLAGCLGTSTAPAAGGDGPTTDPANDGTDTTTDAPGGPGGDDPGTSDPAGGTRPAGTGGPGLAIVSMDDAPALAVRPSVEVVADTATAEHPPQVRVTVTNESDRTVRVGEGRAIVFAYVHDESRELVWLPVDERYDYPAEPDCWRLTDPIAVTEEYRVETLEPGASVERVVGLYGSASGETDACLPVGEFRFTTTYSVTDDEGAPDEGERAEWGFSVSLE